MIIHCFPVTEYWILFLDTHWISDLTDLVMLMTTDTLPAGLIAGNFTMKDNSFLATHKTGSCPSAWPILEIRVKCFSYAGDYKQPA